MTVTRKKLIEVALPLEAINRESLRRKQKAPKGWPTSFHKWWAQRPLAAARAVVFAQLVDDPSSVVEEFPTPDEQERERARLFQLIADLVLWDNTQSSAILELAHDAIAQSWRRACADNASDPRADALYTPDKMPTLCDPFAGSGSIPLSGQWLGIETYASDSNPVAVLINKAILEIPRTFKGSAPVNPESRRGRGSTSASWHGATGLAEDVRYYGKLLRDEAQRRIGHLYPTVTVTPEMSTERPDLKPYLGKELLVTTWLWARTVKSPNPAFGHIEVPLASTFVLSTQPGKEAYVEPVVTSAGYRFVVRAGRNPGFAAASSGTKLSRGSNFRCVMSGVPIDGDYIKAEGMAGRMGMRLLAIVAEGARGRVYLSPNDEQEAIARNPRPDWEPRVTIAGSTQYLGIKPYGMHEVADLFTSRQLVSLVTFTDLVDKIRDQAEQDAIAAGSGSGESRTVDGGAARAYADAIAVYLACAVDRMAYYGSTLTTWLPKDNALRDAMPRQALAMTWDFAEGNPFGKSSGDALTCLNSVTNYLDVATPNASTVVDQRDAQSIGTNPQSMIFSTDPPYYDNVPYADLSDFFYVWMRRAIGHIYPDLFATIAVPKSHELVAFAYRHETKGQAEKFFLDGMCQVMRGLAVDAHPAFPTTIYYAFKQTENDEEGAVSSTGWETFLDAVVRSGLAVTGTWPMRTEGSGRLRASESNALASSIVLVCRPRAADAITATRIEFLQELSAAMRDALPVMTSGQIAPVDLAQASIGPGMSIYSKYAQVLRQDGKPVTVREALQDINSAISAYRTERTSSFDPKTRFCIDFYDQFGFSQAEFDNATVLARAQAVGIDALEGEHLLVAERGKASLVAMGSYPVGVAGMERRFGGSAWEACMRLAATLQEEGESATAALARELGEGVCSRARELAVWLFTIADARKRAQDALAFNTLDASWPEIQRLMASLDRGQQGRFA